MYRHDNFVDVRSRVGTSNVHSIFIYFIISGTRRIIITGIFIDGRITFIVIIVNCMPHFLNFQYYLIEFCHFPCMIIRICSHIRFNFIKLRFHLIFYYLHFVVVGHKLWPVLKFVCSTFRWLHSRTFVQLHSNMSDSSHTYTHIALHFSQLKFLCNITRFVTLKILNLHGTSRTFVSFPVPSHMRYAMACRD